MKRGLAFLLFLFTLPSIACTTFLLGKDGRLVFGRNYDWVSDAGMVYTNQKGLAKTSLKVNRNATISWVSKYGSITFNQYGKEFPNGGMNEKGLVVELMWLDATEFPKEDNRPALDILQWIQYQLDNCATAEEVIATDKTVRIASPANIPLHYLVADANGDAAAIEFLKGKMVVHKGNELPFPVLANSTYAESNNTVQPANIGSGSTGFSFKDNSIQRFATACSMLQQYHKATTSKPLVDYSFDILNNVAQGDFTKWSIVYDITNKKIYFKTQRFQGIKHFAFSAFDFSCNTPAKALNMNQSLSDGIAAYFKTYSARANSKLVETALSQSSAYVKTDDQMKEKYLQYAEAVKCK